MEILACRKECYLKRKAELIAGTFACYNYNPLNKLTNN